MSTMLRRLRWQLTLLYLLAALGLVTLLGGGSYGLLVYYFQSTTDLALQYKMATEFEVRNLPLPPELAKAQNDWLANYSRDTIPTATVPVQATLSQGEGESENGEVEYGDHASEDGSSHESHAQADAYDANLASIFVIPLEADSVTSPSTAAVPPPLAVDSRAVSAALTNGYDWRTVSLPDGTRARLLTYRAVGPRQQAVFQIGRLLSDQDKIRTQFFTGLLVLGALSIVLLGLGSWWLSGRSLNPTQRAWEQQQAFISNASHELRTPLTLIRATAEYSLRGQADAEQHGYLSDILNETDYMSHLVDDLLLLSRLDSHRLKLNHEHIELSALLTEIQRQVAKLAEDKGITLTLGEARGAIWGDPTRMRQVLLILLDNALRHTQPGGTIHLQARLQGKLQHITVEDNGAGIAAEHLPRIFDRFYQVSRPGEDETRSNGLGLSIAKALVEAQGGGIRMESRLGAGTRVVLTFHPA